MRGFVSIPKVRCGGRGISPHRFRKSHFSRISHFPVTMLQLLRSCPLLPNTPPFNFLGLALCFQTPTSGSWPSAKGGPNEVMGVCGRSPHWGPEAEPVRLGYKMAVHCYSYWFSYKMTVHCYSYWLSLKNYFLLLQLLTKFKNDILLSDLLNKMKLCACSSWI